MLEEESQPEQPIYDNNASSINDLRHQAILVLENECLALEKDLENKIKENEDLKNTIEKQDQNNLKMQHDLEQFKMKTQREIMNKAACETKLKTLNEASQTLERYLSHYCKGVNELLPRMDQLKEVLKKKEAVCKENEPKCCQIKDNYEKVLFLATQTAKEMADLKMSEEREFDGIICHLKNQISEKRQQELLLAERFQQADNRCNEMETMIQMLIPQKNGVLNVISGLKSEIARQKESFESENTTLKAAIQEEANKKAQLTEQIANMDNMIDETNTATREQENEAKELDIKMKHLISECDELDQTNKYDVEEINKLTHEVEEKKDTFNSLMAIDEENTLLIKQCEDLQKTNVDLEEKILEKRKTEDLHRCQIEKLDKLIEDAEHQRDQVVKDRLDIEERIKNKKFEMIENERLHKEDSFELDKEYTNLCKKNEQLEKTANERAGRSSKLKKQQEKLDYDLSSLKEKFNASRKKRDDSLAELINFTQEKEMGVKQLREEVALLEESIGRASRDALQACADTQAHCEITERIDQLEEQLESLERKHESELQLLHEDNAKQIKAKQKNLEELRAQKESEFRRMEQIKTNAGIELMENKRFIEELEKQKILIEKELKKTNSNLEKCDLLMQKLEEKLDRVARVAMNSQSVVDPSSQVSNLLSTPKLGYMPKKKIFNSPASESSSGMSINPDKFDEGHNGKGVMKKRVQKTNLHKKSYAMQPKKKNKYEEDDDWIFD